MEREDVLQLPVSQLYLPGCVNKALRHAVSARAGRQIDSPTVAEVITYCTTTWLHLSQGARESFQRALVAKGLTRLDWVRLPQKTVTDEVVRSFGKERLKKLPLAAVCSSELVIEAAKGALNRRREPDEAVLLGEFLAAGLEFLVHLETRRRARMRTALQTLAGRLRLAGFTEEDGDLFRPFPERSAYQ